MVEIFNFLTLEKKGKKRYIREAEKNLLLLMAGPFRPNPPPTPSRAKWSLELWKVGKTYKKSVF